MSEIVVMHFWEMLPSNYDGKNFMHVFFWIDNLMKSLLGGRVGVVVDTVVATVVVGIVWLR